MTARTLPQLHEFADVAPQLGMSLRQLRERACARKFEHVLIGRKRYLTDDQLKGLMAALTVERQIADAKQSQRDADLEATKERVARRQSRRTPQNAA